MSDKRSTRSDTSSAWHGVDQVLSSSGSESSRSSHTISMSHISDPLTPNSNVSQASPFNSSGSPKYADTRRGAITKEKLFAHSSYADDIDFIRDQRNYLREAGSSDLLPSSPENTFIAPTSIAGYIISEQLLPLHTNAYLFRATHEITGEDVVIKLSPDFAHVEHAARFLNDWYVTSGLNPASQNRLWSIGHTSITPSEEKGKKVSQKTPDAGIPVTLPRALPGILYPIKEFNVEEKVLGVVPKAVALVYPDRAWKTIHEFYTEKIRELLPEKTSLWSGSIFSIPSEISVSDSSDRSSLRSQSENTDYVELANRVKQLSKPLSVVMEILRDIIDALKTLSSVHKLGICHNGITSHSLLVSTKAPVSGGSNVYVIGWDFSFSVAVEDSSGSFRNKTINSIQNMLHYMSPESSSGGITSVDYRSDIYSIGVVMYELIVGCLPFRSDNLATLQRMISEQTPIQPKILGPQWISNDLNYVILKCLQKNPSNRYVSAEMLIEDLKLVMKSYGEPIRKEKGKFGFKDLVTPSTEQIPLFHSSLTNINNKQTRKDVFECYNSSKGSKVIVLKGDSGVGKATLVEQISGLAKNKGDFVVHWKYHYADNNVSKHASSMSAVHSVTKQILASSEEEITEWRNIFTAEIDVDLSILFNAVPNLKILLGNHYHSLKKSRSGESNVASSGQSTPGGLGDLLADNFQSEHVPLGDVRDTSFDEQELNTELKYVFIFKKFFTLVARKGLTVFLENLNYCPAEEYILVSEFFQFCISSPRSKLNFVVSFINECSGNGDRIMNFSEFQQVTETLGIPFYVFNVEKLDSDSFVQYVEKFNDKPEEEVTRRIHDLIDGKLLSFNYLVRYGRISGLGKQSGWTFLDQSIRSGSAPASIGQIISKYLDVALTPAALRMLKFAAATCVNGFFTMSELMIVTGFTLKEINELLNLCLETRMIIATGVCYKVPFHLIANDDFAFEIEDSVVWDLTTRATFRFDHEAIRIHLIKEMSKGNELMEIHRKCGLRMKKKISKEVTVNVTSYLSMVSHMYRSCDVARQEDFRHYHEALITGGRYAISTSMLALALKYFTSTLKFVHKDDKRRRLKIMLTQVQCNYLLKNFEESIRLISQAEMNLAKENLSLAHLKVCSLFNLKHYNEGMELAIQSLQRLKIEISSDPVAIKKIAKKYYASLPLSVSEIRSLKTLKMATDKSCTLVTSFIMDMINPTYILDLPDLRIAILSQLVQLMHRHGQNTSCAIPLLHLANHFLSPGEHMSTIKALELADVALDTVNNNKGASTALTQSINEAYLMLMGQFKSPAVRILKSASSIEVQKENKTTNYFITNWMMASSMFLGTMRGYTSTSFSLKKQISFSNETEDEIFASTIGLWRSEISLADYLSKVHTARKKIKTDLEFVALANAVIRASAEQQLQLACELIMGRALELSKKLPVSLLHIWFYFISGVCLLTCTTEETKTERLRLAKEIDAYFKVWKGTCYTNFGPESKLLEACLASHEEGESELTILDLFEDAIDESQKVQNWLGVAMANRLCAKWLQRTTKSQKRANEYAHRAYALYVTMNTHSQASALKSDFPGISESFNWAGVRNMVSTEKPMVEPPRFFDNSPANTRDGSFLKRELTFEGTESIISETTSIPKSERVRSVETTNGNEPTHSEWTEAIRLCLSISESSSLDLIVQTLLESTLMFSGVDYGAVVLNFQTDEPVIKAIGTTNSIFLLDDELLVTRTDLVPYNLVIQCLITGEITCKDRKLSSREDDNEDIYYSNNPSYSGLCIPIKTSTVIGVIYLESHLHSGSSKLQFPLIDSTKIDLLYLLCSQAAVSFSKSVVYTQMELAKKAAEEATDEKASFLANMSHEIRTPFNSLFACSLFLLDTPLSSTQKEYVETIKDSALVTLNIIDGILAFTKIEHGSFTLENESFSINDTIEGAISFSSEQTENVDFEFAYFNKCPQIEMIYGDPTRIRQIIINLVGNALKFTPKGYVKVVLEAEPITDSRYQLKVSVEDTGIGIPEDSRSKVFGAFAQVDGSSRRVYGGSGLGLAISNKLAEIMNGRITFTSQEGVGSVFCFTCPFEVVLNEKDPKVDARDVCIVSNTKWKRSALKDVLEYYGATVALFDNVDDLIGNQHEFEILIVDKNLITEGLKLRSSLNWKQSSIYVLTRFGSMLSDQRLKDIEADSVIFSPIKRKSVRKLLEDSFNWKTIPEKVVRTIQRTLGSELMTKETPKSEPCKPRALSILIAEDNPVNLRVASQHLKKLGYIADHAKDGMEVLEKCEDKLKEKKKYDVIFMDIQMPKKDGIQATIDLRKSFTERGHIDYLPQIIALTANVAGEERNTCLECGMIDFVTKPILPDKLKAALQKVIGLMDQVAES